jgi:hypothetical protein
MAENKAKRSVHLAQPERLRTNPEPDKLMPVRVHAYQTLAELNAGFDKVIHDLETLQRISFLGTERLAGMHDLVCGIRAQANRECLAILAERETVNAGHFDGLCMERGFVSFASLAKHQEDR